jgi:UDP-N-acetyl-D-glucosamine dehydrogenase
MGSQIESHPVSEVRQSERFEVLIERILDRQATVGVIGLGYVGLPLLCLMSARGFTAKGFDIDGGKVALLNQGQSYIKHIPSDKILDLIRSGRFSATSDFKQLADVDIVVVCVPTPLTRQREPDLSFVVRTTESIAAHLRSGQLVVLESTTYPGTTREIMRPILERGGLRSGEDFFLAYSAEREDPGNSTFSTAAIPKVVGGDGEGALRLACAFYDQFVTGTVPVSSPEAAEAVKLTENIFRAVNIALVNELKVVYESMGLDIWEIIDAAKTKPFGYMPFYPGPGLGGHCIPIDPFYLTWKAREYDLTTRFIELAGEINVSMPRHVVTKLITALSERTCQAIRGARVLIIGVAYKRNVDDLRESPALKIMELLERHGAIVLYHDPFVLEIPVTREHPEFASRRSVPLNEASCAGIDAALICTDHDAVPYELLVDNVPLVVDTRNVCARLGLVRAHVVKA